MDRLLLMRQKKKKRKTANNESHAEMVVAYVYADTELFYGPVHTR